MTGVECVKSSLTHPALSVKYYQGVAPKSRYYYHLGGVAPPIDYIVHNSSIVNLSRAVLTRVLYHKGMPPVQPVNGYYSSRLASFKRQLCRHLPKTIPINHQEFPGLYQDRRKAVYQAAANSLLLVPLSRRDSYLKSFVKAERICTMDKRDPDPRVIQPRDPRYNVELGCFLKPIEHHLYQAVASVFKERTIFKGLNSNSAGMLMKDKWNRYNRPVAVGLDASRFDQHVSVDALRWEHSIYRYMFSNHPRLLKLLEWQVHNKGFGYAKDGKLKYSVDGCRMSGDMNTALGNCLIMCALVFAYCHSKGIRNFSLANNGDDCVVIFERRFLPRFSEGLKEWFKEMGFQMKVEDPVYEFEKIEFCQTHPVCDGFGNCVLVRNAPYSLTKDSIAIKPLDSVQGWAKWLRSVAEGGLALTGGLPVSQNYYRCLMRAASKIPGYNKRSKFLDPSLETGLVAFSKGMNRKFCTPSDYSRYSYWLAFGITPDQQKHLEDYFDNFELQYNPQSRDCPVTMPAWSTFTLGH